MDHNLARALADAGSDLDRALSAILSHFAAQIGTIHILEADGMLHLRAHTAGLPAPVLAATRIIPIGKGIAGLAVQRKEPVNLCNLQTDTSGAARPGARATGAGGSICVPILRGDMAVGALGIATIAEREFSADEIAVLQDAAATLGLAVN
jgi:signal transduction protein with GAF and PtsI domain